MRKLILLVSTAVLFLVALPVPPTSAETPVADQHSRYIPGTWIAPSHAHANHKQITFIGAEADDVAFSSCGSLWRSAIEGIVVAGEFTERAVVYSTMEGLEVPAGSRLIVHSTGCVDGDYRIWYGTMVLPPPRSQ
jgi:hypothetical protein